MSEEQHYATAPADRIPVHQRIIYGSGAFANNLLAGAIGGMVIALNLGLGLSPAVVGTLAALPRLTDAITDPVMGFISDRTRSRWGRRRPYIFVGAIAVGIAYALLWQLPEGRSDDFYFGYFLIGSFVFYIAYTTFVTPWVALGFELTPDYHERTRLMGTGNFIGQLAYFVPPWFIAFMTLPMFASMMAGAEVLAILIGIAATLAAILPAIFLRERYTAVADTDDDAGKDAGLLANVGDFFRGFGITITTPPFLLLCIATFLVFNGFIMIAGFQPYVIIYYVFGGDTQAGGLFVGYVGTLQTLSTFAVIPIVTMLGTAIGKRKAFFAGIGISIVGYAIKFVCYTPDNPWLTLIPAPLQAFGLGTLFTLVPAMIADVVDLDELKTRERREGMYGSIFWWVVKLGMALALLAGGLLLTGTGFDVELGGKQATETIFQLRLADAFIPAATSLVALIAVALFPITEQRAHEIRAQLEARRGAV